MTSLDAYCEWAGIKEIDLLKVDVEGMEPWVLRGARRLFSQKRIKACLIEICPGNLAAVGASPEVLFEEVAACGYRMHALARTGEPGERITLPQLQQTTLANAVLLGC